MLICTQKKLWALFVILNKHYLIFFLLCFLVAATTPAIVGVCLGATLFLVGIISVTLFFFRRKSSGYRKSGVYLTTRSPNSEDFPLQSQLIIPRKTSGDSQSHYVRTPHLVMKKSPSPPFYPSPSPRTSPLTPPTDDSETGGGGGTGGGLRGGHNPRSIAIRSNPQAEEYAEIHGRVSRGRSPHLVNTSYGTTTTMSSPSVHMVYQSAPTHHLPASAGGSRAGSRSQKTSPTSPTSSTSSSTTNPDTVMNQRNGNSTTITVEAPQPGGSAGPGTSGGGSSSGGDVVTTTVTTVEDSKQPSHSGKAPAEKNQSLSGGGEFGLGALCFKMRWAIFLLIIVGYFFVEEGVSKNDYIFWGKFNFIIFLVTGNMILSASKRRKGIKAGGADVLLLSLLLGKCKWNGFLINGD